MGLIRISDIRQKEIIEEFKVRKFDILVSTTVAEEGLDIPSCDLVIRYDSVSNNLRSYVQSKGRARDQNSQFLILTTKGSEREVEEKLRRFDDNLKFLKGIADNQLAPRGNIRPLKYYEVPEEDLMIYSPLADDPNFKIHGAKVCTD